LGNYKNKIPDIQIDNFFDFSVLGKIKLLMTLYLSDGNYDNFESLSNINIWKIHFITEDIIWIYNINVNSDINLYTNEFMAEIITLNMTGEWKIIFNWNIKKMEFWISNSQYYSNISRSEDRYEEEIKLWIQSIMNTLSYFYADEDSTVDTLKIDIKNEVYPFINESFKHLIINAKETYITTYINQNETFDITMDKISDIKSNIVHINPSISITSPAIDMFEFLQFFKNIKDKIVVLNWDIVIKHFFIIVDMILIRKKTLLITIK